MSSVIFARSFPTPSATSASWRVPTVIGPECAYVQICFGHCTGRSLVDAPALAVCHNRRIARQRGLRNRVQRGKPSLGWCSGCKLHAVINHQGELLACQLTPGNTDARRPVPNLAERLSDRLLADNGYLSQPLTRTLLQTRRVRRITHRKRNMANRLLLLHDNMILRRQVLLVTVVDQLKHLLQLEHTRHAVRPTLPSISSRG